MMQRFLDLKEQYPDALLFYRLGDFYEMFFDDAKTASSALGLTLTGRDCGLPERAPMCGVPAHSAATYVKRLIDMGFNVAICEQLTAPQKGKTLVERDVVRVITPGTYTDEGFLDETKNNFLAAVYMRKDKKEGSISWADISTGGFYAIHVDAAKADNFFDILAMIGPREIISTTDFVAFQKSKTGTGIGMENIVTARDYYDYAFEEGGARQAILEYFKINSTEVFDIPKDSPIIKSAGALLEYLKHTQKKTLPNITRIGVVHTGEHMTLDKTARDHLELLHQYRDPGNKKGSLLWILDDTKTAGGARKLREMINQPLQDVARIDARLDAVDSLVLNSAAMADIRECLGKIGDLGRLAGRIASREVLPRDMLALARSLANLDELRNLLEAFPSGVLRTACNGIEPLPEVVLKISSAIDEAPPAKLEDGGYIKTGYSDKLDELRGAGDQGKAWISKLEKKEREESALKELKISYNRIIGYFFEIPTRLADRVPYRFTRKGSTANTERYVTDELKQLEETILGAEDRAKLLESNLLSQLRDFLTEYITILQKNAEFVANVDTVCSFASVAIRNNWVRPRINTGGELSLKDLRHPVVEMMIGRDKYIANDCRLGGGDKLPSTMILTGPNMAGKSTYMRSVAVAVLLAHIGSFVPCKSADIPLTDRVFTRIGASDSLLSGQSTFMVEMNEVSSILNNATEASLLLLDEIGRGTGTGDGVALATAILDYITKKIGCKTIFATHFHELTNLGKDNPRIANYKVLVEREDDRIIFLHRVAPGTEQNSFGIDVARLSGIPKTVIDHALKLMG